MAHLLSGHFPVEESARLLRHYRYATERMMRTLGGWLALTPELSAKLVMGRHVWDSAQHADAFGRRLPELRAPAQASEPANAAFVAFMDAVESPEAPPLTIERLVGMYRVLKPHLVAAYTRHLERANAVYEPPTRRILSRCIEDEHRHIAAGTTVLRHLASAPELTARAEAWQARLEGLLAAAGGVAGDGMTALAASPVDDDAEGREFVQLESLGGRWPIPAELEAAVTSVGAAMVAGDAAGAERWLAPDASSGDELREAAARGGLGSARVVACARIGAHRAVKLRLDGPGVSLVLLGRWAPGPDGWRMVLAEVTRTDLARPA